MQSYSLPPVNDYLLKIGFYYNAKSINGHKLANYSHMNIIN